MEFNETFIIGIDTVVKFLLKCYLGNNLQIRLLRRRLASSYSVFIGKRDWTQSKYFYVYIFCYTAILIDLQYYLILRMRCFP